jgi:transposase
MLTRMTEEDWDIVLEVFDAAQSRRGEPGHDDRKFLEALHFFTVHSITWRALPIEFGNWNSVWKRFWRLSHSGVFEAFFQLLAETSKTAHLVQMFDSTVVRAHVSAAGAKGGSRLRRSAVRGGFLKQNPPQDGFRWPADRIPSDRRRSQRLHSVRDVRRYQPRHHASRRDYRQGIRLNGEPSGLPQALHRSGHSHRENTRNRPNFFPKGLYKMRARIEQAVGKLKRFKRIAMRCEKTAESYAAIVSFGCSMILVKSVHTA